MVRYRDAGVKKLIESRSRARDGKSSGLWILYLPHERNTIDQGPSRLEFFHDEGVCFWTRLVNEAEISQHGRSTLMSNPKTH